MGRIRKGFGKGSPVICTIEDYQVITFGKEYTVLEYWGKHYQNHSLYKGDEWPKIMINGDRGNLKKLLPCKYFMPKDEFLSKKRDDKLKDLGF